MTQVALVYVAVFSELKSFGLGDPSKAYRPLSHEHPCDRVRRGIVRCEYLPKGELPGIADADAVLEHNPPEGVDLYAP